MRTCSEAATKKDPRFLLLASNMFPRGAPSDLVAQQGVISAHKCKMGRSMKDPRGGGKWISTAARCFFEEPESICSRSTSCFFEAEVPFPRGHRACLVPVSVVPRLLAEDRSVLRMDGRLKDGE